MGIASVWLRYGHSLPQVHGRCGAIFSFCSIRSCSLKNEADIVFRQELDEIASGEYPQLRLVHVLEGADEGRQGEKGVIYQDMIKRYCDHISGLTFYLCGPSGLIESNLHSLQSLGVEDRQIRLELFTFL